MLCFIKDKDNYNAGIYMLCLSTKTSTILLCTQEVKGDRQGLHKLPIDFIAKINDRKLYVKELDFD